MRDSLLAWAAGLFEGEGCISVDAKSQVPRLTLTMCDEDVVRRFADAMGFGNVNRIPARGQRKPAWSWSTARFELVQFAIATMWAWLGQRRRRRAVDVLRLAQGRKSNRARTCCANGHAFSVVRQGGRERRICRPCRAAYMARWRSAAA